jgi:hypothetical protein
MKNSKLAILAMNGLVAALGYVFAFMYLFRRGFMPYHAVAVGKTWEELDPAFRILTLALMRVSGGGWLGVSIAMTFLLFKYRRTEQTWLITAVFLTGMAIVVPTLLATLLVKHHSSANPPWIAAVAAIILLVTGWILALIRKNNS